MTEEKALLDCGAVLEGWRSRTGSWSTLPSKKQELRVAERSFQEKQACTGNEKVVAPKSKEQENHSKRRAIDRSINSGRFSERNPKCNLAGVSLIENFVHGEVVKQWTRKS